MSSSFRTSAPDGVTGPASVRYDELMQQRIIALASQLQHQHQGTVTAAELEALGVEVGLDPAFVRQAIVQVGDPPAPTSRRLSRPVRRGFGFWDRHVTAWARRDANVLGGMLALVALLSGIAPAIGGLLVTLVLGLLLGPKRRIAWAGAATLATEIVARELTYHFSFFDVSVLGFLALGAALTVTGAVLRGVVETLRRDAHSSVNVSTHSARP